MTSPMPFGVLATRAEVDAAERDLIARGLVPGPSGTAERAKDAIFRLIRRPSRAANLRPDPIKSWDVRRTLDAITATVGKHEAVLDMGSVGCAILPALHALGYTDLHGVDLNPQVCSMAHAEVIDYRVGDLTRTPWTDGTFAAITSISVIEHGVDDEALLREVSRLLRPGGAFYFSTDYWPEHIDTSGIRLFGLPWRIFSAADIDALVATAARHGLTPAGDYGATIRTAGERPIHFADRDYTFLSGAFVLSGGTG